MMNTVDGGSKGRKHAPTFEEITSICFRVTRGCNLSCSYCQAPPNSKQQTLANMNATLEWLKNKGCHGVKFTGGEPTAVSHLPALISKCRDLGMVPTVVTNGTIMNDKLLASYVQNSVRMKVSLHGYSETHNRLQGKNVYDDIVKNITTMIESGVEVSIHTLLYHNAQLDIGRWVEYLANRGVYKVSFMPFISRGRGVDEYGMALTGEEIGRYKLLVDECDDVYNNRIIVRWLDFIDKPYIVYETDGNIYLETDDEKQDKVLYSKERVFQLNYRELVNH